MGFWGFGALTMLTMHDLAKKSFVNTLTMLTMLDLAKSHL